MGAELLSLMNLATHILFSFHKGLTIENLVIISVGVELRASTSLLGTTGKLIVG